jgi:phosphoribosylaminoimidazole carboxylase (NCAIR synthetase)
MHYTITIDRFEEDKAVLKTEDGQTIIWPKNNLPKNTHEGSVLIFSIKTNQEIEEEKKQTAKNILNELLEVSGNEK